MNIKERAAWGSLNKGNQFYNKGLSRELALRAYEAMGSESGEIDLIVAILMSGGIKRDYDFLDSPRFSAYCELINLDDEETRSNILTVIDYFDENIGGSTLSKLIGGEWL